MNNDSQTNWQEWDGGANLSKNEHIASVVGGALLVLLGLFTRSKKGLLVAALGGFLLQRGVTRRCPVYDALGIDSSGLDEDVFETLPSAK